MLKPFGIDEVSIELYPLFAMESPESGPASARKSLFKKNSLTPSDSEICCVYFPSAQRGKSDTVPAFQNTCVCGVSISGDWKAKGCSNGASHVKARHASEYMSVMLDALNDVSSQGDLSKFVVKSISDEAKNIFGWMDWMIEITAPVGFCENPANRRYSK